MRQTNRQSSTAHQSFPLSPDNIIDEMDNYEMAAEAGHSSPSEEEELPHTKSNTTSATQMGSSSTSRGRRAIRSDTTRAVSEKTSTPKERAAPQERMESDDNDKHNSHPDLADTPNPFFGTLPLGIPTGAQIKDDFNPFKSNEISQVSRVCKYST
jgi:hypothetical protein